MKKVMINIINPILDILVQGSLISYYFLNNHNFVIANIVKFIPVLIVLSLLSLLLVLVCVIGLASVVLELDNKNRSDLPSKEEVLNTLKDIIKPRSAVLNIWNRTTDISLSVLLVLTGHPFCLIIFLLTKFLSFIIETLAKSILSVINKENK